MIKEDFRLLSSWDVSLVQKEIIISRDGENVQEFLQEEKGLLTGVHVHHEIVAVNQCFPAEEFSSGRMWVRDNIGECSPLDDWSEKLLRQQSCAIKNQIGHPKNQLVFLASRGLFLYDIQGAKNWKPYHDKIALTGIKWYKMLSIWGFWSQTLQTLSMGIPKW